MDRARIIRVSAAIVPVIAVTSVFFVDLCALIYGCGCSSLWSGAAAACNIHRATGPHCPWCAHPLLGGGVAFLGTMAAQLGILLTPGSTGPVVRFISSLVAFPVVSGVVGWVQGVFLGYWSGP